MATSRTTSGKAYLKRLRVTRVDLVPAGANPEARVTLAKTNATRGGGGGSGTRGGGTRAQTMSDLMGTRSQNRGNISRSLAPFLDRKPNPDGLRRTKDRAAAKAGATQMMSALGLKDVDVDDVLDEMASPGKTDDPKVRSAVQAMRASQTKKENIMPTLADEIAELPEDEQAAVGQYVTDLAAELEAERTRADAAAEALAKAQAEEEDPDAVLKGLPSEVVDRIKKAESDAAEATAKANAIEKAERQRVFKTRAAALVNLSGGDDGADRLGGILDKAEAALDPADYAELERTLVAADEQLTKADDLFKTRGSDGDSPGGGEFVTTVKARAAELEKEGVDAVEAFRQARREQGEAAGEYLDARRSGASD